MVHMARRHNRPSLRPGTTEWGKRRVALGLSQRQVQAQTGLNRSVISLIESSRYIPRASEAQKLLDLYSRLEKEAATM